MPYGFRRKSANLSRVRFASLAAISLLLATGMGRAQENASSEDIAKKLTPSQSLSRSLSAGGLSEAQKQALTRSIAVKARDEIDAIVTEANLPKVDLVINFDFNSADLRPDGIMQLEKLSQALTQKPLATSRFLVNGHTDARGTDAYNLGLSQRRAEAVVAYLQKFGIDPTRLVPLGYGESKLKDPGNGEADENRRVEIVNLTF